MKRLFFILLFLQLSISCESQPAAAPTGVRKHLNLTVAIDFSNRVLRPKPVPDQDALKTIFKLFKSKLRIGQRLYQNDIIRFDPINSTLLMQNAVTEINLQKFEFNHSARIQYLNSFHQSSEKFSFDSTRLFNWYYRTLTSARNHPLGADIPSFLAQLGLLEVSNWTNTFQGQTNKHRNVLILITDGYLEVQTTACTPTSRMCIDLDNNRINAFRQAFRNSGIADMKQFYTNNGYGITPVSNSFLNNLEVLVLEIQDRTIVNGASTVHPTDEEIIKLFWEDWLRKSGVRRFKIYEAASSIQELRTNIEDFLR
jgi:hypothetical protein